MISLMFRIFFAAFLMFCISSTVALAQDGNSGNSPDLNAQGSSSLSRVVVTENDLIQNDQETVQRLHDLGLTSQQIAELRGQATGAPIALQSQQQASFHCPCSVSATSNITFQTGVGFVSVLHEYTSGFRVHVGTMTCPAHALFCIWSASSQRPGLSPSWFIVSHTSYAHRIHWWCS